ncbi:actin-like [Chanos chanos]|uniref:Actin-like n=1 Tax=Chanos chanos TaxID=29144 RepID=A0A6J2VPY3_CHACN|nr:actin-like [Chanos chanos]
MSSSQHAVVIDSGSYQIRVGLSGFAAPSVVCKSVVGRPKNDSCGRDVYFGEEAWVNRDHMCVTHPLQRGKVESWEDLELVWKNVFESSLKFSPREKPVLLSEATTSHHLQRERMCRVMFEALEVPALYLASQSVLALLSSGNVSGCVLDSGYELTQAVPVYEGHCLPHAVHRLALGGHHVTTHLANLLKKSGSKFSNPAQEYDAVTDIKEKMCFVSSDPSAGSEIVSDSEEARYSLPDGQVLQIHSEKSQAPEILFSPETVSMETPGVPSLVVNSVSDSDTDLRPVLFGNVVLAGGCSLIPGFGVRLRKEVEALAPPGNMVRPVRRTDSAWVGGSLLASLSVFSDICISRAEYQETGPSIILHKCF